MVSTILTLLTTLPLLALSFPTNLTTRATSLSPGKVKFLNNCAYPVKVQPFPGPGCKAGSSATVSPSSTWTDALTDCQGGNTALKVYKGNNSKPMQFEYGLSGGCLWYDMSFIDCITGSEDVSQCPGTAWAMRGNDKCQAWKCSAGKECCQQGYCDPYASAMAQEPTSGCGSNEGYQESQLEVVIELC